MGFEAGGQIVTVNLGDRKDMWKGMTRAQHRMTEDFSFLELTLPAALESFDFCHRFDKVRFSSATLRRGMSRLDADYRSAQGSANKQECLFPSPLMDFKILRLDESSLKT
jgi:hypothetical protein